jgi:hypothetical protein
MATWDDIKASYQSQKNKLDSQTTDAVLENKINTMNNSILTYINKAGISTNPDGTSSEYEKANSIFMEIQKSQKAYTSLNNDLLNEINELNSSDDLSNKLSSIGSLQQNLEKLKLELENAKNDVDISKTRQDSVEKAQIETSWYQSFSGMLGFTKPLHMISIPILMGFGILFLFLSALLLREFFMPQEGQSSISEDGTIFDVFTDSRFYAVIGGMTLVFVTLGILSVKGYLGKSLR